jgi:hypothetical protein
MPLPNEKSLSSEILTGWTKRREEHKKDFQFWACGVWIGASVEMYAMTL